MPAGELAMSVEMAIELTLRRYDCDLRLSAGEVSDDRRARFGDHLEIVL